MKQQLMMFDVFDVYWHGFLYISTITVWYILNSLLYISQCTTWKYVEIGFIKVYSFCRFELNTHVLRVGLIIQKFYITFTVYWLQLVCNVKVTFTDKTWHNFDKKLNYQRNILLLSSIILNYVSIEATNIYILY